MEMNVKEALAWASSFLKEHQIEYADAETQILICDLLNINKAQLFQVLTRSLSNEEKNRLTDWLTRRINHEPLQYITGNQDFYGRKFVVNKSVLIPRPETELLVEEVIKQSEMLWGNKKLTVVDIGSGSGAISVSLALEKSEWRVHAIDISNAALEVAKLNAKNLNADVIFHQGDMLQPIIEKGLPVDVIVSNPPYIPKGDLLTLMSEVKDFEPSIALDGGIDGLKYYREIIFNSYKVLKSPGIIAFEVGINQAYEIKKLFEEVQAKEVIIKQDYQGIERIVLGILNN